MANASGSIIHNLNIAGDLMVQSIPRVTGKEVQSKVKNNYKAF